MSPASPPNTDHVEETLGMVMRPQEAGQGQSEMAGPSGASPPGEMSPRRDAEMPQSSISQLYPGPDLWWDLREDPGWWSRAWVSVGLTFVLLFIRTERIIRRGCDKLATHNSSRRLALSARKWRRKYLRGGFQRRTKLCENCHTATPSSRAGHRFSKVSELRCLWHLMLGQWEAELVTSDQSEACTTVFLCG